MRRRRRSWGRGERGREEGREGGRKEGRKKGRKFCKMKWKKKSFM